MKFTFNLLRNSDKTNHSLTYEFHPSKNDEYHNFEEYFAIAIGNLIVDTIESDWTNTGTFKAINRNPGDLFEILRDSYVVFDQAEFSNIEDLVELIPDMWMVIMGAYNMEFQLLSYNMEF